MKNFKDVREGIQEIEEGNVTDKTKLTWLQVNRAMQEAGFSPKDVLKVLSTLSRRIK